MARILVVDSNPDSQRALGGLLKYRTRHSFAIVDSCNAGARQAVAIAPDIILINALMFMHSNYAFPRVMQQHTQTAQIAFLIHSTGPLGEVARRQIEASGVAGVLELPVSGEELDEAIQKALKRRKPAKKTGIQSVSWQKISRPPASKTPPHPATNEVKAVQWPRVPKESTKADKTGSKMKAVQWPSVPKEDNTRTSEVPKKVLKKGSEETHAFQPLKSASRQSSKKTGGFQATTFRQVDGVETGRIKGRSVDDFETQTWEKVDPKKVKRRSPKRR